MIPGDRVYNGRKLGTVVEPWHDGILPGGFVYIRWDDDDTVYMTHVSDVTSFEDGYHAICAECGGIYVTTRQGVLRAHGPRNDHCTGSGRNP